MWRRCFSCGNARSDVCVAVADKRFSPRRTQRKPNRTRPTTVKPILPLCPLWLVFLSILPLKLFHEFNQRFAAGARKGVVNRGANAADRTMAFQAFHACGRRFALYFLFH